MYHVQRASVRSGSYCLYIISCLIFIHPFFPFFLTAKWFLASEAIPPAGPAGSEGTNYVIDDGPDPLETSSANLDAPGVTLDSGQVYAFI